MTKHIGLVLSALLFTASLAGAQPPRPVELGMDAGATIGLGDNSVTVVEIPQRAFRIGFFFTDRLSVEPKFGLTTISGGISIARERGRIYIPARSPNSTCARLSVSQGSVMETTATLTAALERGSE